MSQIAGEALRAGGPLIDFISHLAVNASMAKSLHSFKVPAAWLCQKQHQPLLVGTASKNVAGITPA